jgi:hypothetical protein
MLTIKTKLNIIKRCVFIYLGPENIIMGCNKCKFERIESTLVAAIHDYILSSHMNAHCLLTL